MPGPNLNESSNNITGQNLIDHATEFPLRDLWDMIVDGIGGVADWISKAFTMLLQWLLGKLGITTEIPPAFGLIIFAVLLVLLLVSQFGHITNLVQKYGIMLLGILVAMVFIAYFLILMGII